MADIERKERAAEPRRGIVRALDGIVFSGALMFCGLLIVQGLAQPLGVGRVLLHLLLAPAAAVALHRGLAFLQRRRPGRALGILKWLGSPVAALVLCAATEAAIQAKGLAVVRADLDPVVRRIAAEGKAPADIREALASAKSVARIDYFPGESGFVLSTPGGSIDLEGEVLFYDSRPKEWRRFHRDLTETSDLAAAAFRAVTRGAAPIQYERASDGWTLRVPPPSAP